MLVLIIFLLIKLRQMIIAQIDFAMKREGYEMSFDTMVLTGDNAANPHGIPAANKVENDALLLFDLGVASQRLCVRYDSYSRSRQT